MRAFTLLDLVFLASLGGGDGGGGDITGLEAWWTMDEATGNRLDSTPNAHTLTADDDALDSVEGVFGDAAHLVTDDGRVLSCADAGLVLEDKFTIHFWFKRIAGEGHVMSKFAYEEAPNFGGFMLSYLSSGSELLFLVAGPTGANSVYIPDLEDDTWYFVALAFDPDAEKIMVSLNASDWNDFGLSYTNGITPNTEPLRVGATPTNPGDVEFAIDDLAVWKNRVLTSEQLATIMAGTYPPFGTEEPEDSPLLDGLVAAWLMEEASGPRIDATSRGNDLTDNNTVTRAAGKNGYAAEINGGDDEFLSLASNADIKPGAGSFSVAFWIYPTSNDSAGIFCKWQDNTTQEYAIYKGIFGLNILTFLVSATGSAQTWVSWSDALPANQWSLVVAVFDYATGTIKLSLNAEAFVTESHSGGIFAGGSEPLHIGKDQGGTRFTGRIDEILFYKGRALTQDDVTALYNSGAGIFYPFA